MATRVLTSADTQGENASVSVRSRHRKWWRPESCKESVIYAVACARLE